MLLDSLPEALTVTFCETVRGLATRWGACPTGFSPLHCGHAKPTVSEAHTSHTLSAGGHRRPPRLPPRAPKAPAGLGHGVLVPSGCALGTGPGTQLAGAASGAYGRQQRGQMRSTHPTACLLGDGRASP